MNSTKTVIASQANRIHHYKNVRRKILKCCADIYFNKQCIKQNLIPNYAKLKISNTSPVAKFTKRNLCLVCIRT